MLGKVKSSWRANSGADTVSEGKSTDKTSGHENAEEERHQSSFLLKGTFEGVIVAPKFKADNGAKLLGGEVKDKPFLQVCHLTAISSEIAGEWVEVKKSFMAKACTIKVNMFFAEDAALYKGS